jgi:23S rRNA (pseudouridine1915-N3)-methyltransferase
MKILIRVVGKMRDARLADLCEEYVKRARRHLPIEVLEGADDAALLRGLPPGTELIALEPGGEAWDTPTFIAQLTRHMNQGSKAVAFLIGGAEGLGREVVAACHRRLSLTPLTLPHRLARVILSEQIYRALATIRGEPYNK